MKLRNKKSGGLANCENIVVETDSGLASYNSLDELNKRWEDYKERNDGLSNEDWIRICDCIRRRIAEKCKAISQRVDDYSSQYCWEIAETVIDDFKLLSKVEELCGKETEDE